MNIEHDAPLSISRLPREYLGIDQFYALGNFLGTLFITGLLWYAGSQIHGWPVAVIALFVGILLYRLSIVLHDCTHLSLFQGKRANVVAGTISAAFLFTSFSNFQAAHMAHHKFYRTLDDPSLPDYDLKPNSRGALIWFLLQPMVGYGLLIKLRQFWDVQRGKTLVSNAPKAGKTSPAEVLALIGFQALAAALATGFGAHPLHYLWLVVIPVGTVVLFLSRLRTFLEHGDVEQEKGPPLNCGRNTLSQFLERNIVSPMNFNYHYWHHKYPGIPSAQLPRLHEWFVSSQDYQLIANREKLSAGSFAETLSRFYRVSGEAEHRAAPHQGR